VLEALVRPLSGLDPLDVAIVLGATILAGLVRGFSGFGTAMIMVPPLSLVFGPAAAIPIMSLVDTAGSLPLLPRAVRGCVWREVGPLALGAALLMPLGVYLLIVVDQEALRIAISLSILGAVALLASGWRYAGRPGRLMSVGVGGAAGLMGGSVGVAGPPVILFWLGGQAGAATVRANIIVFFALLAVVAWISFAVGGLVTREVVTTALLLIPVFAASIWLGARGFRRAGEGTFRTLALGIVALVALASLFG
jgi:hypothetical protein